MLAHPTAIFIPRTGAFMPPMEAPGIAMHFFPFQPPDPANLSPYLVLLDALATQCTIFLKDPACTGDRASLALLAKSFCHYAPGLQLAGVPPDDAWMADVVREQLAGLREKILLCLGRASAADSGFVNEHLAGGSLLATVRLMEGLEWQAHPALCRLVLRGIRNDTAGRALAALLAAGTADAACTRMLLWIADGRLPLAVYTAAAGSTSDDVLLQELQEFASKRLRPDEQRALALQCTERALGALRVAPARPAAAGDEFRALLDDKSYINRVKDEILEQAYDPELDDDPLDPATAGPKTPAQLLDEQLLGEYSRSPAAFERSSRARQSKARQALCARLKVTHEQVEGWALMLARNPRKEQLLRDYQLTHHRTL